MSLPIIDSPIPLELNEMWSSYDYLVECFGEDDPEIEKLFDDLYGMRRSSNDSKMIPNEFLELIYERHGVIGKLTLISNELLLNPFKKKESLLYSKPFKFMFFHSFSL